MPHALLERTLSAAPAGSRFQFLRQGYFIQDKDSTAEHPVFNRIVGLKDSWAKEVNKG
jgi:glutaminyl-tRNA synthetase